MSQHCIIERDRCGVADLSCSLGFWFYGDHRRLALCEATFSVVCANSIRRYEPNVRPEMTTAFLIMNLACVHIG